MLCQSELSSSSLYFELIPGKYISSLPNQQLLAVGKRRLDLLFIEADGRTQLVRGGETPGDIRCCINIKRESSDWAAFTLWTDNSLRLWSFTNKWQEIHRIDFPTGNAALTETRALSLQGRLLFCIPLLGMPKVIDIGEETPKELQISYTPPVSTTPQPEKKRSVFQSLLGKVKKISLPALSAFGLKANSKEVPIPKLPLKLSQGVESIVSLFDGGDKQYLSCTIQSAEDDSATELLMLSELIDGILYLTPKWAGVSKGKGWHFSLPSDPPRHLNVTLQGLTIYSTDSQGNLKTTTHTFTNQEEFAFASPLDEAQLACVSRTGVVYICDIPTEDSDSKITLTAIVDLAQDVATLAVPSPGKLLVSTFKELFLVDILTFSSIRRAKGASAVYSTEGNRINPPKAVLHFGTLVTHATPA